MLRKDYCILQNFHYKDKNEFMVQCIDTPYLTSGLLEIIHEFISVGLNRIEPNDQNLTAKRDLIIKYIM